MKKLVLYLFIVAPATIGAMDIWQQGRKPTLQELQEGYIPTEADFKAGYVPTLNDIQNCGEFEEIETNTSNKIFEMRRENGVGDVFVLEIVFDHWGNFIEPHFDQIRDEAVFAPVPTQEDIDNGYKPDYLSFVGNDNFVPVYAARGFCFKSRQLNADGASVVIWLNEKGQYEDTRFRQIKTNEVPKQDSQNDHAQEESNHDRAGSKKKSAVGLFTYIARNKLKLGICCGILAILAFIVNKYGKNGHEKHA